MYCTAVVVMLLSFLCVHGNLKEVNRYVCYYPVNQTRGESLHVLCLCVVVVFVVVVVVVACARVFLLFVFFFVQKGKKSFKTSLTNTGL